MAISIVISYGKKATAAELPNGREDTRNFLLLLHRGSPRYRMSDVRNTRNRKCPARRCLL